ncbi:MAG: LysR family transcriptional regulator [Acidimicrobiales bacterium]
MQIEQLELFVAVVEHGGMTAAGRQMGMTQPAVSRSMSNLERQLGAALFQPDGRGIEPTEAGTLAYERLSALTLDWRRLLAELRRLGGRPDALTIAIPMGTARVLLPPIIRRAAVDLTDTRVHVVEAPSPLAHRAVISGEYDAALIYPQHDIETTTALTVATERLYAVGKAELLCAEQPGEHPIELAELARLPLLLTEPSWSIRGHIDRAFKERGLKPIIAREVGIADALLAFALEGEGVAVLPLSNVVRERELGSLTVREISEPQLTREIMLVLSTGLPKAVESDVRALIASSISEIAQQANWQLTAQK